MSTSTTRYLAQRPLVLGLSKILFIALSQVPGVQAIPVRVASLIYAQDAGEPAPKPPNDPTLWIYLSVAALLVLLGGAFAGLTIALMGQDEIYLQVIQDSGEGSEKRNATKVLRLLHKGKHWVLVTLLLSNVITNETLPIVLDRSLGGGWPAVLGSTVLIVIFGEIVPQSICVRFGLPIGAWMAPFVLALMYIMSPVAWPTAKLLDYLLGEDHGTTYKKAGLKTLVSLHRNMGEAGQRLHADEVTIISAVLDLKEKSIGTIMTPMNDVYTLSLDDVLDEPTMDDILSQGFSRIPVHHPDNDEDFVGMLLVKMLITYDPEDAKPVRDFALATLPETRPSTSCLDIVNFFQEGKSHMVLVSNNPGEDHGATGVVTLEDVIEELIGEEIVDESDVYVDVHKAIRRLTPAPRTRFAGNTKAKVPALINIDEWEPLEGKDLERAKSQEAKVTEDGQPKAKVVAPGRRSSAGSNVATDGKQPRPGNDELRERMKHLGPSNLASRPKTTRYASVKIKPGASDTILTNSQLHGEGRPAPVRRISEAVSEFADGIGEGTVPDGGKAASDAVQALRSEYGTMSPTASDKRPNSPKSIRKAATTSQAEDTKSKDDRQQGEPNKRQTLDPQASNETAGDGSKGRNRSKSPYFPSSDPARSGSITENIIDLNGIRKVVLETTSSSDDEDDSGEENSGPNKHRSSRNRSDSHVSNRNRKSDSSSNDKSDNATPADDDNSQNGSSKKRRRRKRKGGNGKGEEEPLLGDQK